MSTTLVASHHAHVHSRVASGLVSARVYETSTKITGISTACHGGFIHLVWFVSSSRLPYVALQSLDSINRSLPLMALLFLLQHTHHTLFSSSNHSTYCTWREIRRLLLRNIVRVPPSLHSNHTILLLRQRLVIGTIHIVPLLLPSDIVQIDLDQSCGLFLASHIIFSPLIFLQRTWFFITFHPPYAFWYFSNETEYG